MLLLPPRLLLSPPLLLLLLLHLLEQFGAGSKISSLPSLSDTFIAVSVAAGTGSPLCMAGETKAPPPRPPGWEVARQGCTSATAEQAKRQHKCHQPPFHEGTILSRSLEGNFYSRASRSGDARERRAEDKNVVCFFYLNGGRGEFAHSDAGEEGGRGRRRSRARPSSPGRVNKCLGRRRASRRSPREEVRAAAALLLRPCPEKDAPAQGDREGGRLKAALPSFSTLLTQRRPGAALALKTPAPPSSSLPSPAHPLSPARKPVLHAHPRDPPRRESAPGSAKLPLPDPAAAQQAPDRHPFRVSLNPTPPPRPLEKRKWCRRRHVC